MSENVENLVLEHIKGFQPGLDRIESDLREIKMRLGNLESGQASVIQHLGNLSAADAAQQLSIDHLQDRLCEIERRPEIDG